MVALTQLALTALALGVSVEAATAPRASLLPKFQPGVKWEIDIHEVIKHDSAADFIPKEAVVWDIDMAIAKSYPNMIPRLKVRSSATTPNSVVSVNIYSF